MWSWSLRIEQAFQIFVTDQQKSIKAGHRFPSSPIRVCTKKMRVIGVGTNAAGTATGTIDKANPRDTVGMIALMKAAKAAPMNMHGRMKPGVVGLYLSRRWA